MKLKVLVGCEESQAVCIAFRELGHEAYSCDLEPCSGGRPEWHLQMDVFEAIKMRDWDLGIFFPPCTDLASSGAPSWPEKQADGRQQAAIDFVLRLWDCGIKKVSIENPVGILSTVWRKPDQIINPFQFGDPYRKKTCLWLKGLPALIPTDVVEPKFHWTSNCYHGGLRKDGTRKRCSLPVRKAWDTPAERSKTFPGIAQAMAEQWSEYILQNEFIERSA